MPTMTTDSQKPIRQPQARKASADRVADSTSNTIVASRLPSGTQAWGKLPQNPRLRFGLCSVTRRTAPPHSPPSANHCMKRNITNRAGAQEPIEATQGRHSMRKAETTTSIRRKDGKNLGWGKRVARRVEIGGG